MNKFKIDDSVILDPEFLYNNFPKGVYNLKFNKIYKIINLDDLDCIKLDDGQKFAYASERFKFANSHTIRKRLGIK